MKFLIYLTSISLIIFSSCKPKVEKTPYDLVNPFIGTGGHGHTYPGATMPFGMVQLSPDTRLEGWDGCSGYHDTDSVIYGFSHTHLSGTGISDYGDVLFMPTQGEIVFDNGYKSGVDNGYTSPFDKGREKAMPGFYQVHLNKYNIDARLTATTRVGIHEYTFHRTGVSPIIVDLQHRDQLLGHSLRIINDTEIEGSRISKEWAKEQHIYFVARFSKAFYKQEFNTDSTKAAFVFNMPHNEKLMVKVGISAVSIEGARKNLEAEAKSWNFNDYLTQAKTAWEKELNKIEIQDDNDANKEIFYSALYHTMIVPNTYSDVDGQYRGMDQKIHQSKGDPIYTVFSLWDTFRATHPLYTIIERDRTNQFINTFLHQYQDGGILPIWELASNYTGCMIGYHSIPVIADAYIKGIRGYDADIALEAMIHSSMQDKLGLKEYKSKGFIASDDDAESVSKTLEYAYDDWCIGEMAHAMGKEDEYKEYQLRGQYFKNLFNPEIGFMQGKMNGGWSTGFIPSEVNINFTEANSWQYSMFAPQDISGLIQLYGGNQAFETKLDDLFTTSSSLSGRVQADITGLIGQYAHGNEPSHHMAYLYNYIGKPWKTQERVHQILNELYSNTPDGYSGNEDCGQMSAWYVLSSMGFYSVTPGSKYYAIGTPQFNKVTIHLENGKSFIILVHNLSEKNYYIQSAHLNGKLYNNSYINYDDIINGGELLLEMGSEPNKDWGANGSPVSTIDDSDFTPVPYFTTSVQTFTDTLKVGIKTIDTTSMILYSLNDAPYQTYEQPISITESSSLKAYAVRDSVKSFEIESNYRKIKGGRSITLESEYSNQYSAGGDNGLIDYMRGSSNFRTGYWQGFHGIDFSAVVDLGKIEDVHKISIGALQDIGAWIFFPKSVTIYTSDTGLHFKELAIIKNTFPDKKEGEYLHEFARILRQSIQARYIKIEAQNYGPCPSWHVGKGDPTWLFFDEITIE